MGMFWFEFGQVWFLVGLVGGICNCMCCCWIGQEEQQVDKCQFGYGLLVIGLQDQVENDQFGVQCVGDVSCVYVCVEIWQVDYVDGVCQNQYQVEGYGFDGDGKECVLFDFDLVYLLKFLLMVLCKDICVRVILSE